MGACGSTESGGEGEQKKRSQMIDRTLEEDSKKLRRECKILLLGMPHVAFARDYPNAAWMPTDSRQEGRGHWRSTFTDL